MTVAEHIKKSFDSYYIAPLSAWNDYTNLGKLVHVDKEEVIKRNNTVERYSHYIL